MSEPKNSLKKPVSAKKVILRVLLYFVVLDVCVHGAEKPRGDLFHERDGSADHRRLVQLH